MADLFEEPRQRYMETYDIPKGYSSHTELLQDDEIDAVAVVLGHQLHHRLTVDSLNAGKHVLVEKPMALSLEQCDDMIEDGGGKRPEADGGAESAFLRDEPGGEGDSGLGRAGTVDYRGLLHVEELGAGGVDVRSTAAAITAGACGSRMACTWWTA